jgi:hypothetical protein
MRGQTRSPHRRTLRDVIVCKQRATPELGANSLDSVCDIPRISQVDTYYGRWMLWEIYGLLPRWTESFHGGIKRQGGVPAAPARITSPPVDAQRSRI